MEEFAYSKINLGLAILNKRDDGYHNIDSIFQSIRLSDSIYFAKHHSVVFSGAAPELPSYMQALIPYDESNLALKAVRALQEYTGTQQGAAIHLLKRVPVQAGLGGGSADAAAMLKGLNKFWDLRLSLGELEQLGAKLGSDVPFLIRGGTARGTGRGEVLSYFKSPNPQWLLIVKPETSVSTGLAYSRFTGQSRVTSETINRVQNNLESGDFSQAMKACDNTFEELLFPDHMELSHCKQFFIERGFSTIMTGSGPTMVVHVNKATEAIKLQEEIKATGHNWLSLISKTCTEEDLI